MARPIAHSLSQEMTVGGWGCPRLARISRSSTPSRAAAKIAAYSASATNETTTGILVEWAEMGVVNWSGVDGVGDKSVSGAKPMKGAGDRASSRT